MNPRQKRASIKIAIVVLTDEDDCSIADTRPFTPPQFLDPSDPLAMQSMNLRCHFNQSALYPIERYVNGFKALRPGNESTRRCSAIRSGANACSAARATPIAKRVLAAT